MKVIVLMVSLTLAGAAFGHGIGRYQDGALRKADALAAYVGAGETAISKLFRPPKDQSRLVPFECAPGTREVMGQDGAIIGCEGRKG